MTQLPAAADPHHALARVHQRLVPFLCLLFVVNYVDRTNISMAKLQMLGDLHLSDAAYGLGSGLFFIGYFLFELPSNLILHRVGARRWIARIMITWGICSAAMLLTRSAQTFYALRFVLGTAEAGFFPGIVLYLTQWIPAPRRARTLSIFFISLTVSGVVGNPLAGAIMKLDGIAGLHGWQWLFLLEGVPAVLLGIAILAFNLLPDQPRDAGWLTESQKHWLEDELHTNPKTQTVPTISELPNAADGRLALLSAIYFLIVVGVYGLVYFLPTLIKSMTHTSDAKVGLLSAIPYFFAAVAMATIGTRADRTGRRQGTVASCALIGALGLAIASQSHQPLLGIIALIVAAIGIFGALGPFWSIPTNYLRGVAAAGGIAVINSIGNLGGFVAPTLIGWLKKDTGSFSPGLLLSSASLATAAVLVMCLAQPHPVVINETEPPA